MVVDLSSFVEKYLKLSSASRLQFSGFSLTNGLSSRLVKKMCVRKICCISSIGMTGTIALIRLKLMRIPDATITDDILIVLKVPEQLKHLTMLIMAIAIKEPWEAIENNIPRVEQKMLDLQS